MLLVEAFSSRSIVAVVVTYMPELEVLQRLLNTLTPQVEAVVIVDNGASVDPKVFDKRDSTVITEVLCLGENRGIATAQNIGIQWARDRGAEFVLLMDQDSDPACDMVPQLWAAITNLKATGQSVACVGPFYTDPRRGNISPFIRLERMHFKRINFTPVDSTIPVDFVISSGCLIPMSVLDSVGGMQDDLFIDYVDVEWCLRARRAGYQSFGVCTAIMRHRLGEDPIAFFGRMVSLHSPLRGYYRFRNGIFLLRQPWIGTMWKFADARRLLLTYIFFSLFSKSRFDHLKMMNLGLWHGLRGKTGKFAEG